MMNILHAVGDFHRLYAVPFGENPGKLFEDRLDLRLKLIEEEYNELLDSSGYYRDDQGDIFPYDEGAQDIVEMADALGDIVYVCYGMAIEMGIDLNAVIAEIHRANLSKLGADGQPIINGVTPGYEGHHDHPELADPGFKIDLPIGKVLKGPNYLPPDIEKVLFLQTRPTDMHRSFSTKNEEVIFHDLVKAAAPVLADAPDHLKANFDDAMHEWAKRLAGEKPA